MGTQKVGRQPSVPKDQGKRPQGIKKERPRLSSRAIARLEKIQRLQERTVSKDRNTEPKHSLPSPTSNTPGKEFLQTKDRKRKLSQEDEATLPSTISYPGNNRREHSGRCQRQGDQPT